MVLSHHTPQEILDADLYFIDRIGLKEHLSPYPLQRPRRDAETNENVRFGIQRSSESGLILLKRKTAVQSLVLEKTKNHEDICTGVKTVSGEVIKSDITIVTTGGITYPSTGSTGDGYEFARKSGHGIIEPHEDRKSVV